MSKRKRTRILSALIALAVTGTMMVSDSTVYAATATNTDLVKVNDDSNTTASDTATATGDGAIAIGDSAAASNDNAIAIGSAQARQELIVDEDGNPVLDTDENEQYRVVYTPTTASGPGNSIAIGTGATADTNGTYSSGLGTAIAIGDGASAKAPGGTSVAIGGNAKAEYRDTVAIGDAAIFGWGTDGEPFDGSGSVAIGYANVNGKNSVAIGYSASAGVASTSDSGINYESNDSIAILGTTWNNNSIALGGDAGSTTEGNAIAIGKDSRAYGYSVVIGANSGSEYEGRILDTEGYYASVSIGSGAQAEGRSVALGYESSTSTRGVALGYQATSSGHGAIAIGSAPTYDGHYDGSGYSADAITTASGRYAVALGSGSNADQDGSVALGSYSQTEEANTVESTIVINGTTYNVGTAGTTDTLYTVSVGGECYDGSGSKTIYRQIQNVAAGQVSDTSTDAVNGSQLYAAYQAVNDVTVDVNTIVGVDITTDSAVNTAYKEANTNYIGGANSLVDADKALDKQIKANTEAIAGKANATDVYTKTEADALLTDKADADNVYTKAKADDLLDAKADTTYVDSAIAAITGTTDGSAPTTTLTEVSNQVTNLQNNTTNITYDNTDGADTTTITGTLETETITTETITTNTITTTGDATVGGALTAETITTTNGITAGGDITTSGDVVIKDAEGNTVSLKATADAVTSLGGRVDTLEEDVTALDSRVSTLEQSMGEDLYDLEGRVETVEGKTQNITASEGKTTLTTNGNGKITVNSIGGDENGVGGNTMLYGTDADGKYTLGLNAQTGGIDANGNLRVGALDADANGIATQYAFEANNTGAVVNGTLQISAQKDADGNAIEGTGNLAVEGGINVGTDVSAVGDVTAGDGQYSLTETAKLVGNGQYISTNYIAAGDDLTTAAGKLDAQVKTNADAIKTNADNIGDMNFAAANYISDSTTLTGAVTTLDTQVKTNADNIATNAKDIADMKAVDAEMGNKISKNTTDIAANATNIAANSQAIQANSNAIAGLGQGLNSLSNRVDKVGAGAAALAALHPLDYDAENKLSFSAGIGNYAGQTAGAIGAFYRPNEDVMFSIGGTAGNGENMVNAGVSFAIGKGSSGVAGLSKAELVREVTDLKAENKELREENKDIRNELNKLKEMVMELAAKK